MRDTGPHRVAALGLLLLAACATAPIAATGDVDDRSVVFVEPAAHGDTLRALQAIPNDAFRADTFDGLPYRWRTPEPSLLQTRYPLLLVLHDSGAIGTDNVGQLGAYAKSWATAPFARRYAAYVVVPQVATRSADYYTGADGLLASRPGRSLAAIVALVDHLVARLPQVDRSRIYVTGFSMGASAALDALVLRPDLFAGAVTFGAVPPDRTAASPVARVPVMLVHGTRDEENPFGPDHAWAEALARAGGRPVFVRYEGMGHRIPPDLLLAEDWRDWLFRQRRP